MLLKFIVAYIDYSVSVSSIYSNFDRYCILVTYINNHIHMNICGHTCSDITRLKILFHDVVRTLYQGVHYVQDVV